jgi:mono/diheme cytochrome c family protein
MLALALALSLTAAAPAPAKAPAKPTTSTTKPTTMPTLTLPSFKAPSSFAATVTVVVQGVVPPAPWPTTPKQESLEIGAALYAQRCVLCHGDSGAADGVGARRIKPEPQHLDDVIWQGTVSDGDIKKAILDGGAAVSRSPMMPANPDLKTRPDDVQALVDYVRFLRPNTGSATATITMSTGTTAVAHAVADENGDARLVINAVPLGKAKVLVQRDESGAVACTLDIVVVSGGVTATCNPPAP